MAKPDITFYYDIELIDENENIENFKFSRINRTDLESILQAFRDNKAYYEFSAYEGEVLISSKQIRGIMYQQYTEKTKTIVQENMEDAKEIGEVRLKKTIYNTTGEIL